MALLETLDEGLTRLTVAAEAFGKERSWRLGRWAQDLAGEAHQGLSWLSERFGWNRIPPELVATVALVAPRSLPRYHVLTAVEVPVRARQLVAGSCTLEDGATLSVDAVSWRHDRLGACRGSSRFRFHAFLWIWELLQAYRLTGEVAYLNRAKELTQRWITECLRDERLEQVWDDHATAVRVIVLCQLWELCRTETEQDFQFVHDLLATIVRHAQKLACDAFYRPDHNHGVTQAEALFTIGLLLNAYPHAPEWTALGRGRLEAQMARNVSEEGLHREHSPMYHFAVLREFNDARLLAQAYDGPLSEAFTQGCEKMLRSGAYLLKPDGTLPALGDTWKQAPILVEDSDLTQQQLDSVREYLYARSQGRKGTVPEATSVLFPGAGYAVLRSGWGTSEPFADERYLAFRLSTFDTAHIHRDACSFEVYGYGDDLIVDSGGPFTYGHPMRRFFVSTAAHNTVVVDSEDQEVGASVVRRWSTSDAYDFLDVEHTNYPGVTHRRAILFLRPDYFLILDWLQAEQSHRYSQLFHLNPILEATAEGLAILTNNPNGGATLQIVPLVHDGITVTLQRGNTDPPQGWVCVADEGSVANTVVGYQRSGTTAFFAVLLVPEASTQPRDVQWRFEGTPFQGDVAIHVTLAGRSDQILVSRAGEVTVETRYRDGFSPCRPRGASESEESSNGIS